MFSKYFISDPDPTGFQKPQAGNPCKNKAFFPRIFDSNRFWLIDYVSEKY